jgi:hypothetical protein
MLHDDSFDVFPVREDYRCTPQRVASHTLYKKADPFELKEPSGTLRTNNARYEAISDRAVRVSGSQFVHDPEYTIKLKGVRQVGYSTILMGGVRDPYYPEPNRQLARATREWLGRWPRGVHSVGRDQRVAGAVPDDRDEPRTSPCITRSQMARIDFGRRLPLFAA